MKIAAAVKLFFVAPATFAIAVIMIKVTTGPKKPMMENPTTGAVA